jgi:hypothetical protein
MLRIIASCGSVPALYLIEAGRAEGLHRGDDLRP